jgi:hypothetical protein
VPLNCRLERFRRLPLNRGKFDSRSSPFIAVMNPVIKGVSLRPSAYLTISLRQLVYRGVFNSRLSLRVCPSDSDLRCVSTSVYSFTGEGSTPVRIQSLRVVSLGLGPSAYLTSASVNSFTGEGSTSVRIHSLRVCLSNSDLQRISASVYSFTWRVRIPSESSNCGCVPPSRTSSVSHVGLCRSGTSGHDFIWKVHIRC